MHKSTNFIKIILVSNIYKKVEKKYWLRRGKLFTASIIILAIRRTMYLYPWMGPIGMIRKSYWKSSFSQQSPLKLLLLVVYGTKLYISFQLPLRCDFWRSEQRAEQVGWSALLALLCLRSLRHSRNNCSIKIFLFEFVTVHCALWKYIFFLLEIYYLQ